jgi:hypothetical protein
MVWCAVVVMVVVVVEEYEGWSRVANRWWSLRQLT